MRKITILLAAALVAVVTFGQTKEVKQESLASARAKITQVIEQPGQMTEVMRHLTASNQVAFLSEVITAVSKMPGDNADRTAKLVEVVNAALAGAQKGNALALIAEVFATVPPSSLPAVNESLASGLMNRAADRRITYTDRQYIEISRRVMEKVNERVANEDNSGVRSGFAALMLIRGSNSESPEIVSAVIDAMPESVRNDAKTDWFPAALGQNGEKTYDPMLAVVDNEPARPVDDSASPNAGSARQTSLDDDPGSETLLAIRVPSAQNFYGLLSDISGANTDSTVSSAMSTPLVDAIQNPRNYEFPNLGTGGGEDEAVSVAVKESEGVTEPVIEPEDYFFKK